MQIAGVEIGPGQPCRIVAELSNNHNGSFELACQLIEQCADAGADFVKFQCFTPDELVLLRGDGPAPDPWGKDGWSMADLYAKAQTPHGWFAGLATWCRATGVPWFSSVFGVESLALLKSLGCPAYKVAALDVGTEFAALVGSSHDTPVIASSRGERIPWADMTLYCPEGYPQQWGQYTANGLDGVSYHGTDLLAAVALASQSQMFECHVQLDDVPSALEANVSLTVSQLRELCRVRNAA